jgi:hypothetical protein
VAGWLVGHICGGGGADRDDTQCRHHEHICTCVSSSERTFSFEFTTPAQAPGRHGGGLARIAASASSMMRVCAFSPRRRASSRLALERIYNRNDVA